MWERRLGAVGVSRDLPTRGIQEGITLLVGLAGEKDDQTAEGGVTRFVGGWVRGVGRETVGVGGGEGRGTGAATGGAVGRSGVGADGRQTSGESGYG